MKEKIFVRRHGLARISPGHELVTKEEAIFIAARLEQAVPRLPSINAANADQHCVIRTYDLDKYGYRISAPAVSPEWEWSRDMEMLRFTGDPLSPKNQAEVNFGNPETGDEFTIRICFGHPVSELDHTQLWDIDIKGTVKEEMKVGGRSAAGVDGEFLARLCILVPKPESATDHVTSCRITAGLWTYAMFGSRLCTLRVAMDEDLDGTRANNWIYRVPDHSR